MTKTLEHLRSKQLLIDIDETVGDLKPPLKWAGGKRWLIPYLLPIWKQYQSCRLVEPFCGGLAVTLSLRPQNALLNDINPHLMNFYTWLKKGLSTSINMENDEDIYYLKRERFNNLIRKNKFDRDEAALLFYYLNRTGYNGLCRFNNSGEFNVPFGRHKTINYTKDFYKYQNAFTNWIFTCNDFEEISIKANDFIYADPPYDVKFTKYSKENFSWCDQERLAKWLSKFKCPIVISNQATSRIIKLYKEYDFELFFLDAPRFISCNGDRTLAKEVVAIKNL